MANAKDSIQSLEKPDILQRTIELVVSVDAKEILIEISDYAGGIEEELRDRIFDPYFTTKQMGTGIELFIVKTLVEKYLLGSITCKNRDIKNEGKDYKGVTFSIKIPK